MLALRDLTLNTKRKPKLMDSNANRRLRAWTQNLGVQYYIGSNDIRLDDKYDDKIEFTITVDYEKRGFVHYIMLEAEAEESGFKTLPLVKQIMKLLSENGCLVDYEIEELVETSLYVEALSQLGVFLDEKRPALNKILITRQEQLARELEASRELRPSISLSDEDRLMLSNIIDNFPEYIAALESLENHPVSCMLIGQENIIRKNHLLLNMVDVTAVKEPNMPNQTLEDEILRPFAKILTSLPMRQFQEVVTNTKLQGKITQRTDEGLVVRKLREVVGQDKDLGFVAEINGKIRAIQKRYGAIPTNVSNLMSTLDSAVAHFQTDIDETQTPYIFVLLPFQETFFTVFDDGIKPVFEELGCITAHADDPKLTGKVDNKIIEFVVAQIERAAFLVVDTTGHNPNVFYELGYAHAKGKTIFIITQDDGTPPFNIRDWLHIPYKPDAINSLKNKLRNYAKPLIDDYRQGKR